MMRHLRPGLRALTGNRALWQNGAGSMAVKAVSILLAFVITMILARVLGPEGFGVYAYVYALVLLLAIPSVFGLPSLLVRETARALTETRWAAVDGVWYWGGAAVLVLSGAVTVLAASIAWLFADQITPLQMRTFFWGLLLVPLIAMARVAGGALRGLDQVITGQVPDLVLRSGVLVGALLLVLWLWPGFELSAARAMALHALAGLIALGVAAAALMRARMQAPRSRTRDFHHRRWLVSLIPLGFAMNLLILNNQAGIVMLGLFAEDAADVGIYRAAMQGAMLVSFGLTALTMGAAPAIARLHARGRHEELQHMVTVCTRAVLAVAAPVALVFWLWGENLLALAFGEAFAAGYLALLILVIGHLVSAGVGTVSVILDMTGHERATMRGLAVGAAANVVLGLVLIPPFGLAGAAAATAASRVIWSLLLRAAVRRHLGIEPWVFGARMSPSLEQST